jgi:hypothetical protein
MEILRFKRSKGSYASSKGVHRRSRQDWRALLDST